MPVCDPEMPLSFRRWAARQQPTFGGRGELTGLSPGGSSGGIRPVAFACWLAAAGMIVFSLRPSTASAYGWLAADAMAAIAAMITRFRSRRHDLRLCRTAVIFPPSLNEPGRVLLTRTQVALGTILGSKVRAAGLLLTDVPEQVLREHEWQIAGKLREVTDLRGVLAANISGASPGPMTTHVLSAQRQAVEVAQQAIAARVTALERYARQVAAADDADRDWRDAIEMLKLNDRYLDLVARTASDESAACYLAGLAEQLAIATAARNDRLHEADLAAEVLALPENQNWHAPGMARKALKSRST